MISPISFLSNYTVKTKTRNIDKNEKFWKFAGYACKTVAQNDCCDFSLLIDKDKKRPYATKVELNLSVPDQFDEQVENYCNNSDIYYKKSKKP